ncbi:uncharacterized protein VTP21DRAFT_6540 [Calcarisporiella thermophila]|uniref:uncharacterized protein n=1 Tax=Calcarisporiella thermophila TaxID=911321 RepID=UPI003743874A
MFSRHIARAAIKPLYNRFLIRPSEVVRAPTSLALRFARVNYATDARDVPETLASLDRAQKHIEKGTDLLSKGMIAQAMDAYHASVQTHPTSTGYYNMGVCYFQLGRHDDAIRSLHRSLELSPNQVDAHANLGTAYAVQGKLNQAMEHCVKAVELSPRDGELRYNLACVLDARGELERAVENYERAVEYGCDRAERNLRNARAKLWTKQQKVVEKTEKDS